MVQSLAEALFQLRYPDKDRILWADAIYIYQVEIMHHIYCHASQVLLWLGLGADNGQNGFKWIRDVKSRESQQLRFIQESLERRQPGLASRYMPGEILDKWQQSGVVNPGINKAVRKPKRQCVSGLVVEPMRKLLKNHYFIRVWII